jgi:N-terminal domain of molybdenum-binding protein
MAHPSFKLYLEENNLYVMGPGRAALLRAIEELGSLNKAAQKQGMSYRWAWGRIRDAEKALGIPLLQPSGQPGMGNTKVLTPQARELLAWLTNMETQIQSVLNTALATRPAFLRLPGKHSDTA